MLSDALINNSTDIIGNIITIEYNLFSDDDLGQIGTTCDTCQAFLTEDGTFQLMPGNSFTTGAIAETDIFLKSDVPEPSSAGLLLSALGALLALGAWYRRAA